METNSSQSTAGTDSHGSATRRRWHVDQKRRIVEETLQLDMTVVAVAQRHGVNANSVHAWRREYRKGKLGGPRRTAASMAGPAKLASDFSSASDRWPPNLALNGTPAVEADVIEMRLPNGTEVKATGEVALEALRRILTASGVK
jgi:transposase-like protein